MLYLIKEVLGINDLERKIDKQSSQLWQNQLDINQLTRVHVKSLEDKYKNYTGSRGNTMQHCVKEEMEDLRDDYLNPPRSSNELIFEAWENCIKRNADPRRAIDRNYRPSG